MTSSVESSAARAFLEAFDSRQFSEELHPRVPAGSANGGQFGSKSQQKQQPAKSSSSSPSTPQKKPSGPKPKHVVIPKGSFGYDPASNHGTGYGSKNGDKNVHTLQEALNRLGLTDMHGRKLKNDGKLGPLTTSAVKKAQRALGLKADGIVSPAFLKQLSALKTLPKKKTTKAVRRALADLGFVRKFNPDQPRGPDGKWASGGVGDLLASLVNAHSERDDVLFPRTSDGIINWAERRDDGSYGFEVRGDNGDTVYIDLDEDHLKGLHSALTKALTGDDPGLYLAGSSDLQFDWSDVTEEDDHLTGEPIRVLNVLGEDDNGELGASTSVQMTEQDMRDWHSALTITLLRALASPPPPASTSEDASRGQPNAADSSHN